MRATLTPVPTSYRKARHRLWGGGVRVPMRTHTSFHTKSYDDYIDRRLLFSSALLIRGGLKNPNQPGERNAYPFPVFIPPVHSLLSYGALAEEEEEEAADSLVWVCCVFSVLLYCCSRSEQ